MAKTIKSKKPAAAPAAATTEENLLSWANEHEPWRRDALRRHAGAPSHRLTPEEKAAIVDRVRHAAGFEAETPPACSPIGAEHIKGGDASAARTVLHSLGPVKYLNRLAANQTMRFTGNGLTVIFGDNGSGKSGYARVAKKMCRSLSKDELLGNVFEKGPKAFAEIVVRYQIDGAEIVTETWVDGTNTPAALANIGVFDSANARLYVDKQNRISYLPREIALLQEHSAHCTEMDDGFKAEISTIQKRVRVPLPSGYAKGGAIDKMLTLLDPKQAALPTADDMRLLAKAQEGDAEALAKLQLELANDPLQMAARNRRFKAFLEQCAASVRTCAALLSSENLEDLKAKKTAASTTARAASLAATERFASAPLNKDIGSDPWRQMYEHAKAFAQANGMSADKLPDVVGANCALCQEPLTESGAARVKAFNDFVGAEATKAADAARIALETAIQALRDLKPPTKAQVEVALAEYAVIDDRKRTFTTAIASYGEAAILRRNALGKAASGSGTFDDIPVLLPSLTEQLTAEAAALDVAAAAHDQAAKDNTARAAQRAKLAGLQDREKLADDLATVLARLEDLEALARLKKCCDAVGTLPISRQITALRRSLIMKGLKSAIADEIVALDLTHIPFEINDRSVEGQSLIAVDLRSTSTVENSKILSEGEQRALALACFLAETATSGGKHGLVIDDPVSSLDHGRIRRVAIRIAAEAAAGKQIIVFTHNILFYNELNDAAARCEPQVPVHRNFISKSEADGFGLISEQDEPWVLVATAKRIELLKKRLQEHASVKDFTTDEWRRKVTDFYTQLRETWERLVEEVLLGKVVERFNSDVRTMSLKGVTVDDDDYKTVFFAMKRVSERSGHDMAGGKAVPLQTLDDMKKDLEEIDKYRVAATSRKKDIEKQRQALEKPPKAAVA